jgi:hypothetical protein
MLPLFLSGCDRSSAPASSAAAVTGSGIITGRVVLSGAPPSQLVIPGSPQVKDETLVCDASGGIKNVIVYIANAPYVPSPTTLPSAVLDQVNCVYVPHVLAVQTGEPLTIQSSDKMVMHNVQFQDVQNPPYNFGFNGPGSKQIVLKIAEPPFRVKCDVHPWMTAWIGVFDHPYFAVTGSDGSFTISHVPPGNYTLSAWQEALPEQQQSVSVTDGSTTNVQFTFQLP